MEKNESCNHTTSFEEKNYFQNTTPHGEIQKMKKSPKVEKIEIKIGKKTLSVYGVLPFGFIVEEVRKKW